MDFKSFIKNRKLSDKDKQSEQEIKEKIKKFEGKSKSDIMSELVAAVEKGKRDGTLNAAELENFYNRAAPMLNEDQRKKMRDIIEKLK
ncbi:MAG: hypothetical protein LBQ27_04605 [Clostridiales bacterium]|jgi:hypothetical protein|nr:hypothetical protein [Clostridiales bacterium]